MRKSLLVQLLILSLGVLIVLVLFTLPKFIVEDTEELLVNNSSEDQQSGVGTITHSETSNIENQETIKKLIFNYLNEGDLEKKAIFADSIAEQYRKSFIFDSSAYYFELAYSHNPTQVLLEKVALGVFEAFQNSGTANKRKALGQKTIGLLDNILDSNSERIDLQVKKAVVQVYTEPMPMTGITALKSIISNYPQNTEARLYLGEFQFTVGKYDLAIEQFKAVLGIIPTELKALMYLTDCYLALSKPQKAEKYLRILKELNTDDPYVGSMIDRFEQEIKSLKN